MRIPDFFIIGASKCGTTALSEYLRHHPNVCFSRTKEPHFFSDDFPLEKVDNNLSEYWRRNFSYFDARKHKAIGEGSGTYYISDVAVPSILKQNSAAKFIYMVRNPIEMAHSWHYHVHFGRDRDVSFEQAWDLQPAPTQGRDTIFFQYRAMASLGHRLEVFKKLIPPGQLMVIVFDDFIRNPKLVYEDALAFIGVPSDGRETFPQINQSRVQRSRLVGRVSASIPHWVYNAAREFKHLAGLPAVPLNFIVRLNSKPVKRPPLSPDFRKRLLKEFDPEVRLLEQLLAKDLSHWRT